MVLGTTTLTRYQLIPSWGVTTHKSLSLDANGVHVLQITPNQKNQGVESRVLRRLHAANITTLHGRCLDECHNSLAMCADCLQLSVPDLVKMHQWTAEEMQAIEANQAKWKHITDMNMEAASSTKRAGKRRRQKSHVNEETQDPQRGTASQLFLGWSFLISSDRLSDLSKSELLQYFKDNNLPVPSEDLSTLELSESIRRHYRGLSDDG
eukprot:scaffold460_cov445-Prasinococcus_capsulatus_cf.AAC.2